MTASNQLDGLVGQHFPPSENQPDLDLHKLRKSVSDNLSHLKIPQKSEKLVDDLDPHRQMIDFPGMYNQNEIRQTGYQVKNQIRNLPTQLPVQLDVNT